MWKKISTIKKAYTVELNESNNFTVSLNLVGLGDWNYDNTKCFVMLKYIDMHPQDLGYSIAVSRQSGTGKYSCSISTKRLDYNTFTEKKSSSGGTWMYSTESSDTAYTYVYCGAGGHNASTQISVDGTVVLRESAHFSPYGTAQIFSTYGKRKINEKMRKFGVYVNGSSFGRVSCIRHCKYKTVKNTNASVICIFVEGD